MTTMTFVRHAHRPERESLSADEAEAIYLAADERAPSACETCNQPLPAATEQKPGSFVVAQVSPHKGRVECLDCFVLTERACVTADGRGYLYAARYHGRSATSFVTLNRKYAVWAVPFAVRAVNVLSPEGPDGERIALTRLVGYMIGPDGKLWAVAARIPRDTHVHLEPNQFLFVDTWRLAPAHARRVARRHKLNLADA